MLQNHVRVSCITTWYSVFSKCTYLLGNSLGQVLDCLCLSRSGWSFGSPTKMEMKCTKQRSIAPEDGSKTRGYLRHGRLWSTCIPSQWSNSVSYHWGKRHRDDQDTSSPICERSDDQPAWVSQVFITVGQHGIDHACGHVVFFPVVPQLAQPLKIHLARHVWWNLGYTQHSNGWGHWVCEHACVHLTTDCLWRVWQERPWNGRPIRSEHPAWSYSVC